MYENVSKVGAGSSTNGNAGEDLILVSRREYIRLRQESEKSQKELNRLKREREEYREIALELGQSVPKMHEISKNIDEVLARGGS